MGETAYGDLPTAVGFASVSGERTKKPPFRMNQSAVGALKDKTQKIS